jgi:uncharacterized protein HemX
MCRQNHVHMKREKSMDNREYNQPESLTSSSNTEISRLTLIVKNLKEHLESLERNQTDLMSKLNDLQKEMDAEDDGDNTDWQIFNPNLSKSYKDKYLILCTYPV